MAHMITGARVVSHGAGVGAITMSDVQCVGNESSIFDCSYSNTQSCIKNEDVGVSCNLREF